MKTLLLMTGVLCSIIFADLASQAQSGSLDITFNPGSAADFNVPLTIALQPDGKILAGGNFHAFNHVTRQRIVRLNSDGSIDPAFDPGDGPDTEVDLIEVQTDGKILIAGGFGGVDGVSRPSLARLRSDGSLDSTLALGDDLASSGYGPPTIYCMATQTNGQIMIAGKMGAFFNNLYHKNIARLNSDGSTDTTFDVGSGADSAISTFAFQNDGKILVGGGFASFNGTNRSCLLRLNPDGSIDATFNPKQLDGIPAGIGCLAVQTNGQILIGGLFASIDGYTRRNIARLNPDGSLDLTFNSTMGATLAGVLLMALQPDGKILVGGFKSTGTGNATVFRLGGDGSLDPTFPPTAVTVSASDIKRMLLQPDGKVLIGGSISSVNGTNIPEIARLNVFNAPVYTNLNLLQPKIFYGMNLTGIVSNAYRIEYTTLANTQALWTPLFNVTLQTNPQFIIDTNPIGAQRFYRAVALP